MPDVQPADSSANSSMISRIVALVGVASTVISIALTIYNNHTKNAIDAAEALLKERAEKIDESKERVARYTWIRTLFPDLEDNDPQKRAFALALMRLALDKDEAEQLFSGLSSSDNKDIKQAGQAGLATLQTEGISQLVAQLNADTPEARKAAVASLIAKYKGSSFAISAALGMLQESNPQNLSPSGIIDVLFFLGQTDPAAWTDDQIKLGRAALASIEAKSPGSQTRQAMQSMKGVLDKAGSS